MPIASQLRSTSNTRTSLTRLSLALIAAPALLTMAACSGSSGNHEATPDSVGIIPPTPSLTEAYANTVNIADFLTRGTSFTDPAFSPLRLGIPMDEIDNNLTYDFDRLYAVQSMLAGVDRRAVLSQLFVQICAGCDTDLERHLAILEFCCKNGFHNYIQPMWPDGQAVFDPLILMELGEQRCGHTARVAASLFDAAGYETRIVQLGGHVSCEIFYEDDWHYLDANLFGGQWTVYDEDGSIPSYAELSRNPYAIDSLPVYFEPTHRNLPMSSGVYPSYYCFSTETYAEQGPLHYYKTATHQQERESRDYGWEHYVGQADPTRELTTFEPQHFPSSPRDPNVDGSQLTWTASTDPDGDILGYRVYISTESRGWTYGDDWSPEMYDARFRLPPSDVMMIETTGTSIELPAQRPLFVSIMAYDQHGEDAGRTLYPLSIEVEITEHQSAAVIPTATAIGG